MLIFLQIMVKSTSFHPSTWYKKPLSDERKWKSDELDRFNLTLRVNGNRLYWLSTAFFFQRPSQEMYWGNLSRKNEKIVNKLFNERKSFEKYLRFYFKFNLKTINKISTISDEIYDQPFLKISLFDPDLLPSSK